MMRHKKEKRHYPRLIFNEPQKNIALLSSIDEQEPKKNISAAILNMGEGGLQISLKRTCLKQQLKQGDKIMLNQFEGIGLEELSSLTDITTQIVWIMDNEHLEHVLVGVAFDTISEEQRQIIRSFIQIRIDLAQQKKTN
ncbi:MAG: hypothetical protein D3923_09405 [Candidatus Electrothrix sp. AR3]|nr:hypothetical protein [Candidatus Electrothrix sp. AR3]